MSGLQDYMNPSEGDKKLQALSEFWIVSAPGDRSCEETFQKLHLLVKKHSLGYTFKYQTPDLKVGTLDLLVSLSEELAKLDVYVESVTKKIVQYLAEVLENKEDFLKENLFVNGVSPAASIARFHWETSKYPPKITLRATTDLIAKNITQSETELKNRSHAYNALKSNIHNIERKNVGSLMVRSLGTIVKKEDFVLNSEYLATLLVVVPNITKKEWLLCYEDLTDMVVPQSSKCILEETESSLFTVTLFRKVINDFKQKCREHKWLIRDFEYNEEELTAHKHESEKLYLDRTKQRGPLVRWLKVTFSETFSSWLHVKSLRTYVESVLRYGLPVNFQAMTIALNKKSGKKLREVLDQHYQHLDTSGSLGSKHEIEDIPGLNMSSFEYYSYVFFKMDIDFIFKV